MARDTRPPIPTQPETPTTALALLARAIAEQVVELTPKPEPPSDVMTIAQVAGFLGDMSKGKVYQLIKAEGLPTRRIGCAQRVMRSELMEWLRGRPAGGADEGGTDGL